MRLSLLIDVAIAIVFYAFVFLAPTERLPEAHGDRGTLLGAVFFGYVAALFIASRRWADSSYLLQFLANRTPAAWAGTGFAILSIYLLVTWAF
jgi:hypothetical protein